MAYSEWYQGYMKKKKNGEDTQSPKAVLDEINAKIAANAPAKTTSKVEVQTPTKTAPVDYNNKVAASQAQDKSNIGNSSSNDLFKNALSFISSPASKLQLKTDNSSDINSYRGALNNTQAPATTPFTLQRTPSEYKQMGAYSQPEVRKGTSWGDVIYNSLAQGQASLNEQISNAVRMAVKPLGNTTLNNTFDNSVNGLEKQSGEFNNQLKDLTGAKKFISTGLEALPGIVAPMVVGGGLGGAAKLAGAGKLATKAITITPFGLQAAGGYARQAENDDASYGQQLGYGILGGLAEAATGASIMTKWLELAGGKFINDGAKTLVGKYGKQGLQYFKNAVAEGFQEAIVDPMTGAAEKAVYNHDKAWTGDNGVFDAKQMGSDAYTGVAMSVMLTALGLPSNMLSHKLASQYVENNKIPTQEEIAQIDKQTDNDVSNIEQTTGTQLRGQVLGENQNTNPIQPQVTQENNTKPIDEVTTNGNPVAPIENNAVTEPINNTPIEQQNNNVIVDDYSKMSDDEINGHMKTLTNIANELVKNNGGVATPEIQEKLSKLGLVANGLNEEINKRVTTASQKVVPQEQPINNVQNKVTKNTYETDLDKNYAGFALMKIDGMDTPTVITGYAGNKNGIDYVWTEENGHKSGVPVNRLRTPQEKEIPLIKDYFNRNNTSYNEPVQNNTDTPTTNIEPITESLNNGNVITPTTTENSNVVQTGSMSNANTANVQNGLNKTQNELPNTENNVQILGNQIGNNSNDAIQNKLDELDKETKQRKSNIINKPIDEQQKNKELKALGMKQSAKKRAIIQGDSLEQIEGGFTVKELEHAIKKEASNYVGKNVGTPDGNGTVVGNGFGKVAVKREDGTVKHYTADKITTPKAKEEVGAKVETPPQATEKPTEEVKTVEGAKVSNESNQGDNSNTEVKTDISNPIINESSAKRAKENMSHDSYKEGSATLEYEKTIANVKSRIDKAKVNVSNEANARLDKLYENFKTGYAEWTNKRNANGASHVSVMVAGGSNYNMRAHDKYVSRENNLWKEYDEKYKDEVINNKISSIVDGDKIIKSDDPEALTKLREKLAKAESEHQSYLEHNKKARKEGKEQLPSYVLQNSNARIKGIKNRISQIEKMEAERKAVVGNTGESVIKEYEGVTIVKNFDAGRIQIRFDEKPSSEVIADLKGHGWRYSPTNNAWQRKITNDAKYFSIKIMDKFFNNKDTTSNTEVAQTKTASTTQGFAGTSSTKNIIGENKSKLVQHKQMLDNLIEVLDIPVREGRFNKKKALGIFKIREEVIRTKKAEDEEVISHEIGHYLDKLYSLSALSNSNSTIKNELMALGEEQAKIQKLDGKGQISEGIAEFARKYLTGEETNAPVFEAKFEQIVGSNKKLFKAMQTFKEQVIAYHTSTPSEKVGSKISFTKKRTLKEKFKDFKENHSFDRIYEDWIDELRPLQNLVKEGVTKGIYDNPYLRAWQFRGWVGKAESMLKHGVFKTVNGEVKEVSKPLIKIIKPVEKDLDNFLKYCVAKRVIEKENQGIQTGISLDDAYEIYYGHKDNAEFETAHQELQGYQDALLQRLLDGQMISQEQYDKMKEMNKDYVPFYRVMDIEGGSASKFMGKSFTNLTVPVKKMKGSNRSIINPLESIVKNTYYFMNMAERNEVGLSLVEFSNNNDGLGKFIEKVSPVMQATSFEIGEIKKSLENIGAEISDNDLSTIATIFRPILKGNAKEHTVVIYEKGKPKLYQLHPDIYRAVTVFDKPHVALGLKILAEPAKLLRAGAVLSPDFAVKNPIRDMFTAAIYSKYGFIPVVDTLRGLSHVLKKDEIFKLWLNSGGASSEMVAMDRDYLGNGLKKMMSKNGFRKIMITYLKNPIELLRELSSLTEEATRVGDFNRGIKKEGRTPEGIAKAGINSRDITLDFARSGYYGKEMNKITAFFNATLQGQDKMLRSLGSKNTPNDEKMRVLFKSIMYLTVPSMLLWFMYHDDDKIKELPAWRKNLCWNIPTENHVISIPKPFELGIIFGSLPERLLDFVNDKDSKSISEWAKSAFDAATPNLLPTAVTPIIELWANKSFFTGLPIVNQTDQSQLAYQQYSSSTSELAKAVGKVATAFSEEGISPKKIDSAIYGYTGGLGRYAVSAFDKTVLNDGNSSPASGLRQIPGLKGILIEPYSQAESINEYYNNKELAQKQYTTASKQYKTANPEVTTEDWNNMVKNNQLPTPKLDQLHTINSSFRDVDDQLKELKSKEDSIRNDDSLSPSEKQKQINNINMQRVSITRYINETMSGTTQEAQAEILKVAMPSTLTNSISEKIKYNTSDRATNIRKQITLINNSNMSNELKVKALQAQFKRTEGLHQGKPPKKKKETVNPYDE